MSEVLNTYLLSDPETVVPMDRDEFYCEQIEVFKKTGQPTRAVDIVDVFIFNKAKELLVQKRSFDKTHNPGLLDKSIGGHVRYEDTPDYSVMVETVQELQTPSIVLRDKVHFTKTLNLLREYLNTIAVVKHGETKIVTLNKIIGGEELGIANKVHVYLGVYDGRVKPVDREAKGVLWYSLPDLEREMKQFPDMFTHDMHYFMKEYRGHMEEFLSTL